jgi:hypothetical protein
MDCKDKYSKLMTLIERIFADFHPPLSKGAGSIHQKNPFFLKKHRNIAQNQTERRHIKHSLHQQFGSININSQSLFQT